MKKFLLIGASLLLLSGCNEYGKGFNKDEPKVMENIYRSIEYVCVNDVKYFMLKYYDTGVLQPLLKTDGTIEVCN